MAKLVLLLEGGGTRDIALTKESMTIGRRPDNDICLPDPAVSGDHAQIVTLRSDSFLEDLGSTNGTFVNGRPAQKQLLRDGDVIDIGRERLVYLVEDDAVPDSGLYASLQRRSAAERARGGDRQGTPSGRGAEVATSSSALTTPHAVSTDLGLKLARLVVLTGPHAGRSVVLTKEVTSVGRAGVQVALVRRTPHGYVVAPVEGSTPPLVNGGEIDGAGTVLATGDVLEIAGARIEFSAPPDLPA